MGRANQRGTLGNNMKKAKSNNSKFELMSEEATLDCYGEYEQFCGWACILEEKLPLPLSCEKL